MNDEEKKYSRKDIFNILRELRHDIDDMAEWYLGVNRHIYKKAADKVINHLDKYIELDKDSWEDKIKRLTKKDIYKQLSSSKSYVYLMKRDYHDEHKDTYNQAIDDFLGVFNKYLDTYRTDEKR